MKSFAKIGKRERAAIEVLKEGGYFRYALETIYHPVRREMFRATLRDAAGRVVPGYGFVTMQRLRDVGALQRRDVPSGSTYPTEYVLA